MSFPSLGCTLGAHQFLLCDALEAHPFLHWVAHFGRVISSIVLHTRVTVVLSGAPVSVSVLFCCSMFATCFSIHSALLQACTAHAQRLQRGRMTRWPAQIFNAPVSVQCSPLSLLFILPPCRPAQPMPNASSVGGWRGGLGRSSLSSAQESSKTALDSPPVDYSKVVPLLDGESRMHVCACMEREILEI